MAARKKTKTTRSTTKPAARRAPAKRSKAAAKGAKASTKSKSVAAKKAVGAKTKKSVKSTASRRGAAATRKPAAGAKRTRRPAPPVKPARKPARPARKKATASASRPIVADKAMVAKATVAQVAAAKPPKSSIVANRALASGTQPVVKASVVKVPVAAEDNPFRTGDEVKHKVFGPGRVVGVDGIQLQIAFKSLGTKTIIDSFVQPLRR